MGVKFWNGFEDGTVQWTLLGTTPPVAQAVTVAFDSKALKADLNSADNQSSANADTGAQVASGYARAYLYVDTAPSDTNNIAIFAFHNTNDSLNWLWFIRAETAGVTTTLYLVYRETAGPTHTISVAPLIVGAWFCIEVYFTIDGTNGAFKVWINDVLKTDASSLDNAQVATGRYIYVGCTYCSTPYAAFAYADNVIFSDGKIGMQGTWGGITGTATIKT